MSAAWRQEAFGAGGVWAEALRALTRALVLTLALSLILPAAGLSEDLAFHEGHHAAELSVAGIADADLSGAGLRAADPGLACHVHCGCHVTASPCEASLAPPPAPPRPRYARTRAAPSSVFPDRLPRPPRA